MKEGPFVGVGCVVVRNGALLMVRRGREPAKGLWSLPGGRLEHGECLVEAAAREVLEETGVEVKVSDLLGVYEALGDTHFVVLDYIGEAVGGAAEPRGGEDAAEARWVPLEEISTLDCTPRLSETLTAWKVLPGQMLRTSAEK
ncbi:MAG: NUDIX hydrolase [Actinomycetota bacterium]|nr:NUDIX hydrolase [Actinomycetota bacterium]